jgi:hypothetical protein
LQALAALSPGAQAIVVHACQTSISLNPEPFDGRTYDSSKQDQQLIAVGSKGDSYWFSATKPDSISTSASKSNHQSLLNPPNLPGQIAY